MSIVKSDPMPLRVGGKVFYEHFAVYEGGALAIIVFPGSTWIVIPAGVTFALRDALACRNQATHCD
jgi:hypothetical protein